MKRSVILTVEPLESRCTPSTAGAAMALQKPGGGLYTNGGSITISGTGVAG